MDSTIQSRKPFDRGVRVARPHRAAPALPGAGVGHPHHRRCDAREAQHAEGGRCEEIDAYNAMVAAENGVLNGEVEHGCPGGPLIERSVWQYFAVPPDIRSVGMMGDEEMCARVIAHINCEPYDECHKRGFLWV